jgi:hypothetical protein
MPEDKLHESVDDEWSFVQTLRHLVFAEEAFWHNRYAQRDLAQLEAAT